MNLYLFSGLGADSRVFRRLALPENIHIVHIQWPEPLKGESLQAYCRRLMEKMDIRQPFLLGGLSFGGIVCIEISKLAKPEKIIMFSSIKHSRDLPFYYRILGWMQLPRIIPSSLMKRPTFFSYWLFGAKTEEARQVLKQALQSTSGTYTKWAIKQVLSWKNEKVEVPVLHIHGSRDKVLFCRKARPDVRIEGAGHLMLERMEEINEALRRELNWV